MMLRDPEHRRPAADTAPACRGLLLNKRGLVRVAPRVMILRTFVLVSLAACPFAPAADPAWKQELTSSAPGPHPQLAPGVLDLRVSWKGILNSGRLRMEFAPKDAKKPGALVVRSSATSLGAAAAFFPYQGESWSELDPVTFRPRFFHAVESDKTETITTTSHYSPNSVACREITSPKGKGKSAGKTSDRTFTFTPIFDVFSAILHVRSQKLAEGDRINLVIHPFNNPYLLRIKVLGREKHLDRKTIRLSVAMRKIDRKTLELKPYKKIKSDATLWLSDDADRIPVELRAAVFIGDIRATLASFNKS